MKNVTIAIIILLLAAGGGYWYWCTPERLKSVSAVVERRPVKVAAAVSGSVSEVHVRAGNAVVQGQLLLGLDHAGYEAALARERARLAELAALLPPDARVPSPLGPGEPRGDKPLAALRIEEEEARKAVDVAAHVHAAASLALSRQQKPGVERQKALILRDEAAMALQKAKDAFEQASYARARREAQEKAASGGTVSAALAALIAEYQAQISRVRLAEQDLAGTVILAPEDGRVVFQGALPGATVAAGDPLVFILPDNAPVSVANAVFAPKDAVRLMVGQECEILSSGGERIGAGRIGEVFPPDGPEKNVAVRVDLDQNTGLPSAMPGDAVTIVVTLRKPPLFGGGSTP